VTPKAAAGSIPAGRRPHEPQPGPFRRPGYRKPPAVLLGPTRRPDKEGEYVQPAVAGNPHHSIEARPVEGAAHARLNGAPAQGPPDRADPPGPHVLSVGAGDRCLRGDAEEGPRRPSSVGDGRPGQDERRRRETRPQAAPTGHTGRRPSPPLTPPNSRDQLPPLRCPCRSGSCPSLGARRRRYGCLPPVVR
jgi:hypothetical protein